MVLIASVAFAFACIRAILVFPWLVRRWIVRLLFFAAVVYIGLPIQADQDVFWDSAYVVAGQLQTAYTAAADPLNQILGCVEPILVVWNRIAAVLHAVLIVLTDAVGFEDGFRDAPIPLSPETFCTFSHRMSTILQRLVALIEVPVLLFFDIISETISFVSDIENLSYWEIIVSIFTDLINNLLGFEVCFRSWEGLMFCLCSPPWRRIWTDVSQVPSAPLKAWAKCLYPPYDGTSDPIFYGLNVLFGFIPVIQLYEEVCTAFTTAQTKLMVVADFAIELVEKARVLLDFLSLAVNLFNQLLDYSGPVGKKVNNILESVFGDSPIDDLTDPFTAAATVLNNIRGRVLLTCPVVSPFSIRNAAPARAPPVVARRVTNYTSAALLTRLPGAWNRSLARAGMDAAEFGMWMRVLNVAQEALAAPAPVSAHVLAGRMRASGVDFRTLPMSPAPRCLATYDRRTAYANRGVALIDESWWTAALGVPVILFGTLVIALVFPPAVAFCIGLAALSAFSTLLLFISGTAFEMANAVITGELDRALALPAMIYTAQYVGRAYWSGGLLTIDGLSYITGVLPELEADANYLFQLYADRPSCTGLVTPFCLPHPDRRDRDPLARIVGAIQCDPDQTCAATSDCSGRAKGCVGGKCLCWMYMPIGVRLPTLTIAYSSAATCEAYGYTNKGLLPRQTGGLSWTNVINTFSNFWAAMRDVLRALTHRYFSYAILGVAAFAVIPPVRQTGKTLAKYAITFAVAQYGLSAANDRLGWVAPPDHGMACAVYSLPSVVLWAGILTALAFAVAAVAGAGIVGALVGVLWALVQIVAQALTTLVRIVRPYRTWYYSGAQSRSPLAATASSRPATGRGG